MPEHRAVAATAAVPPSPLTPRPEKDNSLYELHRRPFHFELHLRILSRSLASATSETRWIPCEHLLYYCSAWLFIVIKLPARLWVASFTADTFTSLALG
jgi:hypothetical protein